MEIEIIENIESALPLFQINDFDIVAIPWSGKATKNIVNVSDGKQIISPNNNNEATGSGFGTPESNREVEQAAISHITNEYIKHGWSVISVETEKCGYDLSCSKGKKQEHVEVKGIQGNSISFIITTGEVKQSRLDENFVLCVVTSALTNPQTHRFTAKEFNGRFALEIVSYHAYLKPS
jgi:hypothetical protein